MNEVAKKVGKKEFAKYVSIAAGVSIIAAVGVVFAYHHLVIKKEEDEKDEQSKAK